MKAGAEPGAIPANVSVSVRASVTAGFAKLVEEVKKYAPPMYAPTANGATLDRPERTAPNTTSTRPTVAMTSASHRSAPVRPCAETVTSAARVQVVVATPAR